MGELFAKFAVYHPIVCVMRDVNKPLEPLESLVPPQHLLRCARTASHWSFFGTGVSMPEEG